MPRNRRKQSLRERLAWPSVLSRAFQKVVSGANPDSAGPDGITIDHFRKSARAEFNKLQNELRLGTYSPAVGRGVAIWKKHGPITPGTARPITVFNVRDRIVQRAILDLIWPHVRNCVFTDVSFGGIRPYSTRVGLNKKCLNPGKNVRAAAKKIMELRRDGYGFTFETDIQRFFPSIDKEILKFELGKRLPDNSLSDLIDCYIATSVSNYIELEYRGLSECWDPSCGVPQGGVLSPLLANLYLASFDAAMIGSGFELVRYIDDFVVLTKTRDEALGAFSIAKQFLASVGLEIHELDVANAKGKIKTRIVECNQQFHFLGLTFNKSSVHPYSEKLEDLRDRLRQLTHGRTGKQTLVDVVISLNRLLRGWANAYSFCDVPPKLLAEIDHVARTCLASWMAYHQLIRSRNSLTSAMQRKIGLWSVTEASIEPLSRKVFLAMNNQAAIPTAAN